MRAVVITHPGGPDALEWREVPDPDFRDDEVRVRVRASALNRADLLQRRGLYPAPPDSPPDVPGLEFAGEVEAAGSRVRGLAPGDRVMGVLGGGGQAEKVVAHEGLCLPIPDGLSWEEAAAVPEAFLTAFDALVLQGRLASGETVLVHAAASGVGTAACQIASAAGARAIGLSRTREKRARLEEMGLHAVLDPASRDLAGKILDAAPPLGVNLVLDLVGAAVWPVNLSVLSPLGRIVVIGLMGGAKVQMDLSVLLTKRVTVIGTVLRGRALNEKIAVTRAFRRSMLPFFESKRLTPVIDRTMPMVEVAAAHEVMERNENFGKVVLRLP